MEEYRKYEPFFGSWYLVKLLGRGSFGKVFEIQREELGVTYRAALKIISIPQDDEEIKDRMVEGTDIESVSTYYEGVLREIINENDIMAQLKGNSNIVSYEDHQIIPHDDKIGYDILIRMELLTPLVDHMLVSSMEEEDVIDLGIDMCRALELCHNKNIIHRDIKPQNIFLSDSGNYKLGDFGISRTIEKTTGGLSKKGTYKYMAPEVYRGDAYGRTVDIYSLGIVMYSLLNGNRSPFLPMPPEKVTHNDEEQARVRRFRGEPLPKPVNASEALSSIILRACAYRPEERFYTASQMRQALEYLKNNDPEAADMTVHMFSGTVDQPYDQFYAYPQYGPLPGDPRQTYGYQNQQGYAAPGMYPGQSGRQTGQYQYQMPQQQAFDEPVDLRAMNGDKQERPAWLIPAIIGLAAVIIFAGLFMIFGRDSDVKDVPVNEEQNPAVLENAGDVIVKSSDWDWDSAIYDANSGLYRVDAILWIKNNSDKPVCAIEFNVDSRKGNRIEDAKEADMPLIAYGYVESGTTAVMLGEVWTQHDKIRPDDSSYEVIRAYCNDELDDYIVPSGNVTDNYGPNNDYYDISVDNPNDSEVNENSKVVMIAVKKGDLLESDATGHLNRSIPAETYSDIHEKAFVDPNLYERYQDMSVYVIDVDHYDIERITDDQQDEDEQAE